MAVYVLLGSTYDLPSTVYNVGKMSRLLPFHQLCLLASFLSNSSLASPSIPHLLSKLDVPSGSRVVAWTRFKESPASSGCNLNPTHIPKAVSRAAGTVKIYKTTPPRSTTFIVPLALTTTTTRPRLSKRLLRTCILQGRRVRVLDPITNAVHSPTELSPPSSPQTPSPTLSDSTASSLTTPPTPHSLFSTMPLPAPKPHINPAITYTGIPPYLCFDLAFPPSYLLFPDSPTLGSDRSSASSSSFESINMALLSEQATYPASSSITLLTEALPWSITVTAKSTFVTVYDVLQALHSSLRLQVTAVEWGSLSRASQDVIAVSFHKRVSGFSDRLKRVKQLGKGARRLDFLAGQTRLHGISPLGEKPGVFRVHWEVGRALR